jgi:hypothetical protein
LFCGRDAAVYQDLSAAKGYLTRALWSLASAASLSPLWSPLWLRLHIESGEVLLALGDVKTALWHFSQHLAGLVARPVPSPDATAGGRGRQGAWFRFHRELCTGCLYLGATLQSIMAHDLAVSFLMRSAGACHALAEGYVENAVPCLSLLSAAVGSSGVEQGENQTAVSTQIGEGCASQLRCKRLPLHMAKVRVRLERSSGNPSKEVVKVDIILDRNICSTRQSGSAERASIADTLSEDQTDSHTSLAAGHDAKIPRPEASRAGPVPHPPATDLEKSIDDVHKALRKDDLRIRTWLSCAAADLERLRRPVLPSLPTTPVAVAMEATNKNTFKDEDSEDAAEWGAADHKTGGADAAGEAGPGDEEEEDWDKELEIEEKV